MGEIKLLQPYKEFLEEFNNKLIYTKRNMSDALKEQERQYSVQAVIKQGKDCDVSMKIVSIHRTPEGTTILVE